MTIALLTIFLVLSGATIAWGLMDKSRFYQFPTLAGAAWLFYIGPMAIGVVNNPEMVPWRARESQGIEDALLVSTLCVLFGFIGYTFRLRRRRAIEAPRAPQPGYADDVLFAAGLAFLVIASVALLALAGLSGGLLSHYSTGGHYSLEWRGLPVAYAFFVRLFYVAIALCLFATLQRVTPLRLAVLAASILLPLANAVLLARRTPLVIIVITLMSVLYLCRGWAPGRATLAAVLLLGGVMVIVVPHYRAYSQLGADHSQILRVDPLAVVQDITEGDVYPEFVYPCVQIPATEAADEYNYGIGFYNRFIRMWIPSLIFGRETKESLLLDAVDFRRHTLAYSNWLPNYGWIPTATVDVFREFGYAGPLLFLLVGALFRRLWEWARSGSAAGIVFYASVIFTSMTLVISGITPLISDMAYFALFLTPVFLLAKRPAPQLYHGLREPYGQRLKSAP